MARPRTQPQRPDSVPATRDLQRSESFVGRDWVWSEFEAALWRVRHSSGGAFLISGPPGIGKTRLVRELRDAAPKPFRTGLTRCSDLEGTPALWPWIQILRELLNRTREEDVRAEIGPRAEDVYRRIRALCEGVFSDTVGNHSTEESVFQCLDAASTLIRATSRLEPILIVLEDLHRADRTTLLQFEFLAREIADAPIALVGTYRNTDAEARLRMSSVVRSAPVVEVELPPLAESETLQLAEAHCPVADRQLRDERLLFLSGGVPRFAIELAGWDPRELLPRGIQRAADERRPTFTAQANLLLEVASVVGGAFDSETLVRATGIPVEIAMEHMDEAIATRLIREVGGIPGRYAFCPPVLAQALYEGLGASRQLAHHRAIAAHLEEKPAKSPEVIAELARHYAQIARFTDPEKAVEFAIRASHNARQVRDYAGAATHLRNAIDSLELIHPSDPKHRASLLIELGKVHSRAGTSAPARAAFEAAAQVAEQENLGDALAEATLGLGRIPRTERNTNRSLVGRLRRALEQQPEDAALRAKLLALLAIEISQHAARKSEEAVHREAVDVGARSGDAGAHGIALLAHLHASDEGERLEDRMAIATRVVELARQSGDEEIEIEGRVHRLSAALGSGNGGAMDIDLEGLLAATHHVGEPHIRAIAWRARALFALIEGRFDTAGGLIQRAFELAREWDPVGAQEAFTRQMLVLRHETGELAELEPLLREVTDATSRAPVWRSEVAWFECQRERKESARLHFERLAHFGFPELLSHRHGLVALCRIADVCCSLGDRARAGELVSVLSPYQDVNAEAGDLGVWYGSVSYYLGQLERLTGNPAAAATYFENALRMNLQLGARAWMARTQIAYAELLQEDGESQASDSLRDRARQNATELGMENFLAAVSSEPALAQAAPPPSASLAGSFSRAEGVWKIAYGERSIRLRDQIGLRHIATLLSRPGREIHALELFCAVRGTNGAPSNGNGGDADLEQDLRTQYGEQLAELQESLEEARNFNDLGRVAALESELESLTDEIAKRMAEGGPPQVPEIRVERARVSVTRTIKAALTKIDQVDQDLGAHLKATIRKGTYVSYNPDPRVPVEWSIQLEASESS